MSPPVYEAKRTPFVKQDSLAIQLAQAGLAESQTNREPQTREGVHWTQYHPSNKPDTLVRK